MRICVVGTGYVGLVVGTCLADQGFSVVCTDRDAGKIDQLKQDIYQSKSLADQVFALKNQVQRAETATQTALSALEAAKKTTDT